MRGHKTVRILGLDPGIARTGFGVVEKVHSAIVPVAFGCITTNQSLAYPDRLLRLEQQLLKILRRYQPSLVAIEKLFFYKNVKTAFAVGQARGVLLLTVGRRGIPIDELTPQQVKTAVTGYGKADKRQVQRMVQLLLRLSKLPTPDDTADALAAALTAAAISGRP